MKNIDIYSEIIFVIYINVVKEEVRSRYSWVKIDIIESRGRVEELRDKIYLEIEVWDIWENSEFLGLYFLYNNNNEEINMRKKINVIFILLYFL